MTQPKSTSDQSITILEALRFAKHLAKHLAKVGRRKPWRPVEVTVHNNQVFYSDGASALRVTFEERNFMDERRENWKARTAARPAIAVGTCVQRRGGARCRVICIHDNEPRYLLEELASDSEPVWVCSDDITVTSSPAATVQVAQVAQAFCFSHDKVFTIAAGRSDASVLVGACRTATEADLRHGEPNDTVIVSIERAGSDESSSIGLSAQAARVMARMLLTAAEEIEST